MHSDRTNIQVFVGKQHYSTLPTTYTLITGVFNAIQWNECFDTSAPIYADLDLLKFEFYNSKTLYIKLLDRSASPLHISFTAITQDFHDDGE